MAIDTDADPARAKVTEYGISVWALVGAYLATREEDEAAGLPEEATVDVVADSYGIPSAVVREVLAFYGEHRAAIDAWLATNAA